MTANQVFFNPSLGRVDVNVLVCDTVFDGQERYDTAFFDFDKSVLKPEGKAKLDDVVSKLGSINLEVIIAVGHTDNIGTAEYNQALSMRRANAVKDYLVSKGVEKNRIYTEGKGEKQPVTGDKSSDGRSKNRRVEVEVVGTRTRK